VDNSYQSSGRVEVKWLPDNATGSAAEQIAQEWTVDWIGDDKHRDQRIPLTEQVKSVLPGTVRKYHIHKKDRALRYCQQKIRFIEGFRMVHPDAG
jgi:hypothetical protein